VSAGLPNRPSNVVIGVGNAWGGDDAVGLRVVRELRGRELELPGRALAGVRLIEHEGEPTALLERWDGAGTAVLVDAVRGGGSVGSVHRFDATAAPVPSSFAGTSTHAFSVAQAIELGRALGRLPGRVVVIGVEGVTFEGGQRMTPAVEGSVSAAADAVLAELGRAAAPEPGGKAGA
jgi:hydrogenase maturation protease